MPDPGGLAKAYAALFGRKGGRFMVGDAPHPRTIRQPMARSSTDEGTVTAREVVVAMGPWSDQVFRPLGYSIPLNVKRGYHVHLKAARQCRAQSVPCSMPIRAFCWRR